MAYKASELIQPSTAGTSQATSSMMNTTLEAPSTTYYDPSQGLAALPVLPTRKPSKNLTATNGYLHFAPIANGTIHAPKPASALPSTSRSFLPSLVHSGPLLPNTPLASASQSSKTAVVQCKARTRVPTPHGPVFLHIYHNNIDNKEHLAIVVDPEQLNDDGSTDSQTANRFIRSKSLDARWHEGETDMERLIRGAYVGRLSPTKATPSRPRVSLATENGAPFSSEASKPSPIPVVRIHSECFTGETIGSMRCDCGEQLDEAIRFISEPQLVPSSSSLPSDLIEVPGRGAVVYMRQEGRGIGLLEKIRAYNLQDMGHDTVSANLLLGHGADERGYGVAAAIMRDLGLGSEGDEIGVRVLTNNPDKMDALKREGIRVHERLAMIPRSWSHTLHPSVGSPTASSSHSLPNMRPPFSTTNSACPTPPPAHTTRISGATMIGGGAVHGADLEKYLRTKVLRMGHLLALPPGGEASEVLDYELVTPRPKSNSGDSQVEEMAGSPEVRTRPL